MWSDVIPQDVQALGAELAKRAVCEREAGRTIYPPQEQIFRALELTTPEKVKVCLVGQDPYHEAGQANGLCFSVNRGVLFPPSLKNVFKELVSDIGCPYPKSGDLTLCNEHHDLVHKDRAWEAKMKETKAGLNKKYHALSVLNQIIPALTEQLAELFPQHAFVTTGEDTADFREDHGIAKEHHLDAYCIACSVLAEPSTVAAPTAKPHRLMQFRRHDRQGCHKENIKRVYLLDGKAVATNRHKAIEQKDDSLEEFCKTHTQQEVSALTVKGHKPIYKEIQRFMPGGVFLFNGKVHTLQGSQGRYKGMPKYYIGTDGEKNHAKRCIFLQQNCGLRWA